MYGSDVELPPESAAAVASSTQGPRLSVPSGRRLALLVGGLVALWLVGVFARQVGEASTAANEADQLRARNAAMARDVASLEQELQLIKQPAYVSQVARGYLLGSPREIPFTVDPNAPALPADAPGSIGIKPDPATQTVGPLEAWLQALFGSQP